jgi:hypothetical protein
MHNINLSDYDNFAFDPNQFIKKVDDDLKDLCQLANYGQIVRDRGRDRTIKKFIEELYPLRSYLKYRIERKLRTDEIIWKNGNQKGDALLNGNETIEITVAEHESEWIVRENMNRGKPTFDAEGISKSKNGEIVSVPTVKSPLDRINAHTEMINNAVKNKSNKYDKIDSLVIYLNQDGILVDWEFEEIIKNIDSTKCSNITNLFIVSFQYQSLLTKNNGLTSR